MTMYCPHCGREIAASSRLVPGETQKARLALVLSDLRPHSTFELVRKVYGINTATVARLASRVDELRRDGWNIISRKSRKNPSKWWYMALCDRAAITSEILQDEESIIYDYDNRAGEYD